MPLNVRRFYTSVFSDFIRSAAAFADAQTPQATSSRHRSRQLHSSHSGQSADRPPR